MMQATYKGIPGDSKVVEMFGLTFFEGQPVDVSGLPEDQLRRLAGNPHFTVSGGEAAPKRRGRPPKQQAEPDTFDDGDDA